MKKAFILLITLTIFISCDDGDFDVPSFDFETTIGDCGTHVLYRLSSSNTEALILTLSSSNIQNIATTTPTEIDITSSNVNYRVFSDQLIASSYFCADIPPTSPTVTRDWEAISGTNNKILISTTEDTSGTSPVYNHEITLQNLVLESNGETLTYETYLFGSFQTN